MSPRWISRLGAILAAAIACSTVAAAQPLEMRIQMDVYPTGINAGLSPHVRIVVDEFETGQARVRYGEVAGSSDSIVNATTSQLSVDVTQQLLGLAGLLTRMPEPEHSPRLFIVGDDSYTEVWIAGPNMQSHYMRGDTGSTPTPILASLIGVLDREIPRDRGQSEPIAVNEFSLN